MRLHSWLRRLERFIGVSADASPYTLVRGILKLRAMGIAVDDLRAERRARPITDEPTAKKLATSWAIFLAVCGLMMSGVLYAYFSGFRIDIIARHGPPTPPTRAASEPNVAQPSVAYDEPTRTGTRSYQQPPSGVFRCKGPKGELRFQDHPCEINLPVEKWPVTVVEETRPTPSSKDQPDVLESQPRHCPTDDCSEWTVGSIKNRRCRARAAANLKSLCKMYEYRRDHTTPDRRTYAKEMASACCSAYEKYQIAE